jgi:hypothetical protein
LSRDQHTEQSGCLRRWGISNVKNRGLEVILLSGSGPVPGETIEVIARTDFDRLADALGARIKALEGALVPFAFIGRGSMEPLGLGEEYTHARHFGEAFEPETEEERDFCLLAYAEYMGLDPFVAGGDLAEVAGRRQMREFEAMIAAQDRYMAGLQRRRALYGYGLLGRIREWWGER